VFAGEIKEKISTFECLLITIYFEKFSSLRCSKQNNLEPFRGRRILAVSEIILREFQAYLQKHKYKRKFVLWQNFLKKKNVFTAKHYRRRRTVNSVRLGKTAGIRCVPCTELVRVVRSKCNELFKKLIFSSKVYLAIFLEHTWRDCADWSNECTVFIRACCRKSTETYQKNIFQAKRNAINYALL
jgi:hypothetical protein